MTDTNINNYILGESSEDLTVSTSQENRDIAIQMATQAARTLCIASRSLDAPIYNNSQFCQAIQDLATRSKYSRIRMLLRDVTPILQEGHCLLDLTRRLTSFMEIRCYGPDHSGFNEAFITVDGQGYIHRMLSDRYEGTANFYAPFKVKGLNKVFQEMWDNSVTDTSLRRLHI
jgi:hypothetical protein